MLKIIHQTYPSKSHRPGSYYQHQQSRSSSSTRSSVRPHSTSSTTSTTVSPEQEFQYFPHKYQRHSESSYYGGLSKYTQYSPYPYQTPNSHYALQAFRTTLAQWSGERAVAVDVLHRHANWLRNLKDKIDLELTKNVSPRPPIAYKPYSLHI